MGLACDMCKTGFQQLQMGNPLGCSPGDEFIAFTVQLNQRTFASLIINVIPTTGGYSSISGTWNNVNYNHLYPGSHNDPVDISH